MINTYRKSGEEERLAIPSSRVLREIPFASRLIQNYHKDQDSFQTLEKYDAPCVYKEISCIALEIF